jgi:hypothetical protein
VDFLDYMVGSPEFAAGAVSTHLIDQLMPAYQPRPSVVE